ncbi:MAG: protein kinase, partial [Ktedonobacteraceae bacterium]
MDDLYRGINAAFQKGQQVEQYQVVEVLAPTRFGHTYLGRHMHQPLQVLIEGLLPPLSGESTEAFLKSAQALKHLAHSHILRVRDRGMYQDYPFIITDYFPYRVFNQVYLSKHPHPLITVLPHLKKIASALDYAHSQSVVHGDIRPENILLSSNALPALRGFLLEAIVQNRGCLNYRGTEVVEREAMIYAAPE